MRSSPLLGPLLAIALAGSARSQDDLSGRWEQTYPPGEDQAVLVLEPGPRSVRDTPTVHGRLTIEGQTVDVAFVADEYGNWFGGYELPGKPGVGVLIGRPEVDEICFQAHHGEVSINRNMRRVSRDGTKPPPRPPTPQRPPPEKPAREEPTPPRPARPAGPWETGTVVEVETQVITWDTVLTKRPGAADASTDTQVRFDATYQDTVEAVVDDDGRPTRVSRSFLRSTRTAEGRAEKTELEGRKVVLSAPTPGRWSATLDGREPTGPAARALAASLIPEEPTTWRLADGPRRETLERLNRGQAPGEWPLVIQSTLRDFSYNVTRGEWSTDLSGAPGRSSAHVTLVATQRMTTPEGEHVTERTRRVTIVQALRTLVEGPPPAAPPLAHATPEGGRAATPIPVGRRYRFVERAVNGDDSERTIIVEVVAVAGVTVTTRTTTTHEYRGRTFVRRWENDAWKPSAGPVSTVGRERVVVSGVAFDCLVEEYTGGRMWVAVDGAGKRTYPDTIRHVSATGRTLLELIEIVDP